MLTRLSNLTLASTKRVGNFPISLHKLHRSFSLDFHQLDEDPLDETAASALAKSCYLRINWKISEDSSVYDAIQIMSANNIGALGVVGGKDGTEVIGMVSERDYLNKVGLLGRTSKETKVREICTSGRANLISVTLSNPIDHCMKKMIDSNVRHLFVRDNDSPKETGKIVGLISVKDIVKCSIAKHEAVVSKLYSHVQAATAMKYDT